MNIVISGKDAVLGRLCSYAAKQALLGKEVAVIHCSDVVVSGSREMILSEYKTMMYRGGHSLNGPFHVKRNPEMIVKRTIRGMLSYKQGRGLAALKRIRCYNSVPKELESQKAVTIVKPHKGAVMHLSELVKLV